MSSGSVVRTILSGAGRFSATEFAALLTDELLPPDIRDKVNIVSFSSDDDDIESMIIPNSSPLPTPESPSLISLPSSYSPSFSIMKCTCGGLSAAFPCDGC
uniref:Uncharacterized protein n=1 Tax=Romanomermis culicivorax TaxID=13658 RepID=A0A915JQI4_ROMCU